MLRIDELSKSYGSRCLLDRVSLQVRPGDRIGLIGRNGEGKTTLLRILAGLEPPDDGGWVLRKGARTGYLRQEIDPSSPRALIDEVRTVHAELHALEERMRTLEGEMAACSGDVPEGLARRYDEASEAFRAAGGYEAEADLRATLVGLGIRAEKWERPLSGLSGGWLMRVELAKLLLARPAVLLLDEPTNHLDLPSIQWFEGVLERYPGAVVVVSHDRRFLDRHVDRIAELSEGRLTSYTGNYSAFERSKAQVEEQQGARRVNLERQIQHAQRFVERFGAKATKATQAESRKKTIERLEAEREELGETARRRELRFQFRAPPRTGKRVLRLRGVDKAYADKVVYRGLDLEITRGERIALVGPNGAGKSTLLRAVAGEIAIDAGSRELGAGVEIAYYAQHQLEALDTRRSVLEEVEAAAPLEDIPRVRGLLGTFLFSGEDVHKKVSVLSGGEKARVALAKLLLGRANLLVLDEPTNHLDIQAREMLAGALAGFPGTLLFISHDRSFIDAIANQVIEVTPGDDAAQVRRLGGGFEDYLRSLETASAAAEPPTSSRAAPRTPDPRADAETLRQRRKRARDLRKRLGAIESQIDELERQVEQLGWKLADPEQARDGARLRELELERRAAQAALERLYGQWESLSGQLEALEADDT